MTQSEKKLLIIFSTLLLIVAVSFLTCAYFRISESVLYQDNTVGFQCTTDISEATQTRNGDTIASVRTFNHSISTSDGNKLTDLSITVTASASPTGRNIDHISASLTEQHWDGLTTSEHIVADTATVILFQDQLSVCHFQYRISADGEIRFLH